MKIQTITFGSRSPKGSGFLSLAALLILLLLASCKPTERNYQTAYELALEKRNAKDPDADIIFGTHELQSPIGAVNDRAGEIAFKSLRVPLTRIDGDSAANAGRYRIAIALYSMKENARAHAADLRRRKETEKERDPGIGVFREGNEKYFVTIASLPSLTEAAATLDSIRRADPEARYIGLHQTEPLLLISPR